MSKQQIIKLRKALPGVHLDTFFFLEGQERGGREKGDNNGFILLFWCKIKAFKFNFINFRSHSPILRFDYDFLIWGKKVLFSLIIWGKNESASENWYTAFKELMFGSLMLSGYFLGSQMFVLVTNRIRSGNYILSRVENKGVLAWLHNKWQQNLTKAHKSKDIWRWYSFAPCFLLCELQFFVSETVEMKAPMYWGFVDFSPCAVTLLLCQRRWTCIQVTEWHSSCWGRMAFHFWGYFSLYFYNESICSVIFFNPPNFMTENKTTTFLSFNFLRTHSFRSLPVALKMILVCCMWCLTCIYFLTKKGLYNYSLE